MVDLDRVKTALVRRIEAPIARHYQRRHPGCLERAVWRWLRPFTLACIPDDRWNLHVFVAEWLKVLDRPGMPTSAPRRLFMFCAFRVQFTHSLALACLLAWRGHRVTVGYLPRLRSPIKSPREDVPNVADYLADVFGAVERRSGGRVRCVDLSPFDHGCMPTSLDFIERRARDDAVMAMRREVLDDADPVCCVEIDHYRELARHTLCAAETYFAEHAREFDLGVIPNGCTFAGNAVLKAATDAGLPCNSHDKFSFRGMRLINHGNHIRGFEDLDLIWDRRHALGLSERRVSELAAARSMDMVNQRRSGNSAVWATTTQRETTTRRDSPAFASPRDGMRDGDNDPFVLVCTNVPFDAGYDRITTIFPSMRQWLIATIKQLQQQSSLSVVLRAHPDEARWTEAETAETILREAGVDLSQLTLIPGKDRVNTYDLMERAQCGVVFSSTVGLEMAMMGKTVLVGSDVYYARKGFTLDPDSRRDYLDLLTRLVSDPAAFELSEAAVTDAKLYYFLLHFAGQWPYPYDKPSSIGRMPPAELVGSGQISRYLGTLDAIATDPTTWQQDLGAFLNVHRSNHLADALAQLSA